MALFMITKSTYLKGRQCLKRQWFTARGLQEPEIEPDELWEERLREGAHVEGCAAPWDSSVGEDILGRSHRRWEARWPAPSSIAIRWRKSVKTMTFS